MTKHRKRNTPVCAFGVLFCLTMITFCITGGLYAKYVGADDNQNSARVITFGQLTLTETGDFEEDGTLRIIPGVNLRKKAVVNFEGSEASTYIFVKITPSSDFATTDHRNFAISRAGQMKMKWTVSAEWTYLQADGDGSYIYYKALRPNTTFEADIFAEDGKITVSDSITKTEMSSLNAVSVGIRAFAVQNGGFADPVAAWSSLVSKES